VLRALRVLRVLRLLTMVPSMRRVVGALLGAIPGLGSVALVLLIIYYVFAVIATNLFAATHPEWFGDIGRSLYTLFQIMTLESWSMGIARPVMEHFPYAWAFFMALFALSEDVRTSRAGSPTATRIFCESGAPGHIAVRQRLIPKKSLC
jgi:voltage-gated sodium channel